MSDFTEIDKMTLYEYEVRMKAFRLQQVDQQYEIHQQAWANWNVQAMKAQGKNKRVPVFKNFKQFFDYEKYVKEILGGSGRNNTENDTRNQAIINIMKRQQEKKKTV